MFQASLLAATLALTACSGNGESAAPKDTTTTSTEPQTEVHSIRLVHCHTDMPEEWQTTPSNLRTDALAEAMNVDEQRVKAGKYGPAICDMAVKGEDISAGRALLAVDSISDKCIAIGKSGNEPPKAGDSYKEVIAVCATPS
jgi:hypothetical protein